MEITTRQDGAVATLVLTGRLTITDAPGRLKAAAVEALAAGAQAVLLDLSQVPYIDSTRLGELIATHIAVSRQRRRLLLICHADRITALLRLAGLEGIFETFPSEAAARRALEV